MYQKNTFERVNITSPAPNIINSSLSVINTYRCIHTFEAKANPRTEYAYKNKLNKNPIGHR